MNDIVAWQPSRSACPQCDQTGNVEVRQHGQGRQSGFEYRCTCGSTAPCVPQSFAWVGNGIVYGMINELHTGR